MSAVDEGGGGWCPPASVDTSLMRKVGGFEELEGEEVTYSGNVPEIRTWSVIYL